MIGAFYIDDIDIYAGYGVAITEEGYDDLLAFPALKDPDYNDWPEEDGVEVDLENPRLEAKEVTVHFASDRGNAGDLIFLLSKPGYHTLRITQLGRSWRLRLLTQSSCRDYSRAVAFSLKFADDFPVRAGSYPPAAGLGLRDRQRASVAVWRGGDRRVGRPVEIAHGQREPDPLFCHLRRAAV